MMNREGVEGYVSRLKSDWFICEPGYFATLCTHRIDTDGTSECPVRCGGGVISISPQSISCDYDTFEEMMKMECLRILLKHPYQRIMPDRKLCYIASNVTISENTTFSRIRVPKAKDILGSYGYDKLSMEEYYDLLKEKGENGKGRKSSGNSSSGGAGDSDGYSEGISDEYAEEATGLWGDDAMMSSVIDNVIEKIRNMGGIDGKSNGCGSIGGDFISYIVSSNEPKYNYRRILHTFRGTVLSSKRNLTRMKPSRRFGFKYMGSRRIFTTKLLVAVDVSGSIEDDDISRALGFINGFFRYGVEEIWCCTFDVCVDRENVFDLTKRKKEIHVKGRGGTSYDDVFDYAISNGTFDGVLIYTDGYADTPNEDMYRKIKRSKSKFVWCANNRENADRMLKDNGFCRVGNVTYID